jgi:hypothetical protein
MYRNYNTKMPVSHFRTAPPYCKPASSGVCNLYETIEVIKHINKRAGLTIIHINMVAIFNITFKSQKSVGHFHHQMMRMDQRRVRSEQRR